MSLPVLEKQGLSAHYLAGLGRECGTSGGSQGRGAHEAAV